MKSIWAIGKLTWKAAFRFRLFYALCLLLLLTVVALPLLLKDDGTARGFIQILLAYNLSIIAALLGFATLWLSCGTLSREIEDCQMQLVAVKPVGRWRIWLGKWLGILTLNGLMLGIAGSSVYGLIQWRARTLPAEQQKVLREEVFVARAALKERPTDLDAATDRVLHERLKQTPVPLEEQPAVRQQIREQIKAGVEIVPPHYSRRWEIEFGFGRHLLRDEPLFLRFRFHAARTNELGAYMGEWHVGPPGSGNVVSRRSSFASDTFHELQIPPNLFDEDGTLTAEFVNRDTSALLFPMEDGFEVLYREGGFALNYMRGLMVILSWLGLLSALGLAAGSLLSFPVAAFFSLSILVVSLSSGTMASVVQEGTVTGLDHETGSGGLVWIDRILLPVFRVILGILRWVERVNPIDALSTGRSITWWQLGESWLQIVVLGGGALAVIGIAIFTNRELALPQGNA